MVVGALDAQDVIIGRSTPSTPTPPPDPSARAQPAPKDDTVAGIRALHNAARCAVKARTTPPATATPGRAVGSNRSGKA
ncbi:hypothetical protein [Streptomyces sp. NPDC018610]|uniref:hypothetical protein n=1 Tax=Streptomyces sp. NPDC018610 TaxID=3365049 RepID=UPI0037AD1771